MKQKEKFFLGALGVAIALLALFGITSTPVVAQEDSCGVEELAAEEYGKVIELCTTYVSENPNDAMAYLNLGEAYYWLEDDPSAIEYFNRSIELDSSNQRAFFYRGYSNYYSENFKAAIQDFTAAIEIDSDYEAAYAGLGYAYGKLGDYNTAIEKFSTAIEIDNTFAYAYWGRADAYYYMEADRFALQDYVSALVYYEDNYDDKYLIQERINELIELHVPAG